MTVKELKNILEKYTDDYVVGLEFKGWNSDFDCPWPDSGWVTDYDVKFYENFFHCQSPTGNELQKMLILKGISFEYDMYKEDL